MATSQKTGQRTPEEQIGYLLKRLMHQFRHLVDERLRRSPDVSFAHLVTLDQLQQEPGIAGAQLARRLLVTAQTMTGLLRRLEKEGSVERRPDPHNRRADRWYLLPAGQERLEMRALFGLTGHDADAVAAVGEGSVRVAQLPGALRRRARAGRTSRCTWWRSQARRMSAVIGGLFVYPVKSAAGIPCDSALLDACGLQHDREWMIVDAEGRGITQRDENRLALLRIVLDATSLRIGQSTGSGPGDCTGS